MTADDVINQMAWRYANCQTYQDTGRVEGGQGLMTFSTYFVRPNKFRFDWTYLDRDTGRCSIWTNGLQAFAKHARSDAHEEESSLGLAIAGATGVSQGAAHTTSTLLMPDVAAELNSRTLLRLFPYQLFEMEKYGVESCHKARYSKKNRHGDLWIRAADFALIKFREEETSTPEDDEHMIAALSEIDPAHAEEMRQYLSSLTDKERHSVSTAQYETVIFDASIDEAVFKGSAN